MLEHFGVPSSAQDMRLRERARSEAIDGLAGRTVWCAAAVPERRSAAEALRSRLGGAGAVAASRLDIAADGPLCDLARQLDAMLSGHARGQRQLDAEQQEIYAGASRDGEALIGGAVRHDDIVVISDPFVAVLAEAVRERGALVVWQLELGPRRAAVARAWSFIERLEQAARRHRAGRARGARGRHRARATGDRGALSAGSLTFEPLGC
jgi:hypothetical protein